MAEAATPLFAVPDDGPGVVAAAVYAGGRRVANIAVAEARAWSRRPGHVVWIGLLEPDDHLLRQVQAQFGLHDLAIEDARNAHQRPKLEQYGDGFFVVARTAQMIERRIAFGETHLFVGAGYVVSVRHGASTSYAPVRERCESCPASLSHAEDYILHAVLDFIVDNYMPVLETIHAEVEEIEDSVLQAALSPAAVERLYQLRRDLLPLRKLTSGWRDSAGSQGRHHLRSLGWRPGRREAAWDAPRPRAASADRWSTARAALDRTTPSETSALLAR